MKSKNNEISLDRVDLEILKALQEDSQQTYTTIGNRLHLAHSTVYDRVKKMENAKIINGYTALVDPEKAGVRNILAIVTIYTDPRETGRVAEKLAQRAEVLEAYTSFSDELLIVTKVVAQSQEDLHEFIANSVAPMDGVLRIRTSIVTKKLKETHFSIMNYASQLHL